MISIVIFVLSWRKADNKKLIPFYLCMVGCIYCFEYVILVLLKSYEYDPGVFKNAYFDNVLGANVSNGFIVPSITVFIAVFDLGFWWIILITACFLGVEWLFLYLGVYRHFWWRTIYTGLCLLVLFVLGKWMWRMIRFHSKRIILRLAVLYFANISSQGTFIFYYSAIFHLIFYRVGWFEEPTRGHIAFSTLYILVDSIFFSLAVVLRAHFLWKACLIGSMTGINVLLHKLGILEVPSYWSIGLLSTIQTGVLCMLLYMHKLLIAEKSSG